MAQENYAACVAFTRKQEGGNTDTPGDPGGRTGRGGITHATYDAYRSSKGLPTQDVFKISDEEIADIYAIHYWNPIYGDRLPAGQDLALFDYAINSGPAKANQSRILAGDGDVPTLIHRICSERLSFLHSLGTWSRFGPGWGRRVAACEATALKMAGALSPSVVAQSAQAQDAQKKKAARVITAGAAAASVMHYVAGAGKMIIIVIIVAALIAAAIAIFNAWRQGQRTDTLSSAIQEFKAAQATAAKTAAMAMAQVTAKEKAVAAEQAAIIAAKAALDGPPPQSQPPAKG